MWGLILSIYYVSHKKNLWFMTREHDSLYYRDYYKLFCAKRYFFGGMAHVVHNIWRISRLKGHTKNCKEEPDWIKICDDGTAPKTTSSRIKCLVASWILSVKDVKGES